MRSGRLDRRITIYRKSVSQSDSGEEVVTWVDVAEVWAEKINTRGSERFAAQQLLGHTLQIFKIRWSPDVKELTSEHRILFDGRYYDITDVRETKRREEIEFDCYAPSEQPVTP